MRFLCTPTMIHIVERLERFVAIQRRKATRRVARHSRWAASRRRGHRRSPSGCLARRPWLTSKVMNTGPRSDNAWPENPLSRQNRHRIAAYALLSRPCGQFLASSSYSAGSGGVNSMDGGCCGRRDRDDDEPGSACPRSEVTVTPAPWRSMRRTGASSTTAAPSSAAATSANCWVPPGKWSCWAPFRYRAAVEAAAARA